MRVLVLVMLCFFNREIENVVTQFEIKNTITSRIHYSMNKEYKNWDWTIQNNKT